MLALAPWPATAQVADTTRGKWWFGGATGPTWFSGDEGQTVGLQLEWTLSRQLASSHTRARLEFSTSLFDTQPIYPCLLNTNGVCFSTSKRAIIGVGVGIQRFLGARPTQVEAWYLVGGLGTYISYRKAEQRPACRTNEACADVTLFQEYTDRDVGLNLGVGKNWRTSRYDYFAEARLHKPVWREHRDQPLTNFTILPLTVGIRF
jgi:hypothetical protein